MNMSGLFLLRRKRQVGTHRFNGCAQEKAKAGPPVQASAGLLDDAKPLNLLALKCDIPTKWDKGPGKDWFSNAR